MNINYDSKLNPHRSTDSEVIVPILFATGVPESVIDVGCGTGTWTNAARKNGAKNVLGIDGNQLGADALISTSDFIQVDFVKPWNLGRRFDMLFCLEVAEHLDESCAKTFVESLTAHADHIIFSAACPGQEGQHHVNCQWPEYWQKLFNDQGYSCDDLVRPQIWADQRIAPWYRQNTFVARRDPQNAGNEPRVRSLLHPEIFGLTQHCSSIQQYQNLVASGMLPWKWYITAPFTALWAKVKRRLSSK